MCCCVVLNVKLHGVLPRHTAGGLLVDTPDGKKLTEHVRV